MSFFNKYLKYKQKYLNLACSTKINIIGPSSVYYYKNNNLDKKIIILFNTNNDNIYDYTELVNTVNIDNYLSSIFETNFNIDLFVEINHPDGNTQQQFYYSYYIKKILNFCIKNYEKKSTKNIHYTNIKDKIQGFDNLLSFIYVLDFIDALNIQNIINSNINLLSLYNNFSNQINNLLEELLIQISNKNFINSIHLPKILIDEIINCKVEILDNIFPIMQNYLQDYFCMLKQYTYLNNLDTIYELFNKCIFAIYSIFDFYVLLKILKNNDAKNCILCAKDSVCNIILEYLTVLNFTLVKNIENTDLQPELLTNIIPFCEFFKSK